MLLTVSHSDSYLCHTHTLTHTHTHSPWQDYQRQMETLDGDIAQINVWMDGAETHMDTLDAEGPNDQVLQVWTCVCVCVYSGWFCLDSCMLASLSLCFTG